MLGRRQGEVAPTRKVALKIEMRPTGRPRQNRRFGILAWASCRIRAAGL